MARRHQNSGPLLPDDDWITASLDGAPRTERRLILCLDGTGNQYSEKISNVLQFYNCLIKKDRNQKVFYHRGLGTDPDAGFIPNPVVGLTMKLDAAFAWNLEDHVQDAYRFLVQNYRHDDEISIFGFSRGAYTAQVLCEFVRRAGLLPRGNEAEISFAWNLFKHSDNKDGSQRCAHFKKISSLSARIHFVGLWDTVAAIGIAGRELPGAECMRKSGIHVFRQALALDEHRGMFTPTFKFVRNISDQHGENRASRSPEHFEEETEDGSDDVRGVWFAGCHCDVGGGSVPNGTRNALARIPLRWMIRECFRMNTGIIFDKKMLIDCGFDAAPFRASGQPNPTWHEKRQSPFISTHKEEPDSRATFKFRGPLFGFLLSLLQWLIFKSLLILCRPFRHFWRLARYSGCGRRSSLALESYLEQGSFGRRNSLARQNESSSPVKEDEVYELIEDIADVLSPMYDQLSINPLWSIIERWPIIFRMRDSSDKAHDKFKTRRNLGQGRKIYGDAWNYDPRSEEPYIEVHASVFQRMRLTGGEYRPYARLSHPRRGDFHWGGPITSRMAIEQLSEIDSGWKLIKWVDGDRIQPDR